NCRISDDHSSGSCSCGYRWLWRTYQHSRSQYGKWCHSFWQYWKYIGNAIDADESFAGSGGVRSYEQHDDSARIAADQGINVHLQRSFMNRRFSYDTPIYLVLAIVGQAILTACGGSSQPNSNPPLVVTV